MLRAIYTAVVLALIVAIVVVTVLPTTEFQEWWIRAMAFPRIQILVAAAVLVVASFFLTRRLRVPALIVLLACFGFQAWKVIPYSPLASQEMRGEAIGSDHFPMLATVRIDPDVAAQFNAAPYPLESDDAAEVDKLIDEYGATLELELLRR